MSKFRIEDIDEKVLGSRYQHVVLIYEPREEILSYPAIWLSEHGYTTGFEYAKILQRFCNYLADGPWSSDEVMLLSFWRFTTANSIKAWKTKRIEKKYAEGKVSPSIGTIDREGSIICKFLDWVKFEKKVNTLWDGNRKTVTKARAIHNDLLRGIAGPKSKEVVDVNTNVSFSPDSEDYPIEGLAKRQQTKPHEYLHDSQLGDLFRAFPDVVYKYIGLIAYITGVRDFEVLGIPYWRTDRDGNVFISDPNLIRERLNEETIILKVLGKGKKLRNVKIDMKSWLEIMESWSPIYEERKKLYEKKTGEKLPLHILWLDKSGNPIYCPPQDQRKHYKPLRKLQDAFYYVNKGRKKDPLLVRFGRSVDYYCLRHTYATNYVLQIMEVRRERERNDYINDHSLRHDLANQMGHSSIDTTFSKYIDNAIVILKDREAGKATCIFPSLHELLNSRRMRDLNRT
ncbi:hypothetical protein [Pelosinus sp. sgz500959]|uniref:hypothetical protein n=1 Tax=Pelosinus sp. sgz500959 TaxID=3242472 RepID=UPI00366E39E4